MDPTVQVALITLAGGAVVTPTLAAFRAIWNRLEAAHQAQLADRDHQIKELKETVDYYRDNISPALKSVQESQKRLASVLESLSRKDR